MEYLCNIYLGYWIFRYAFQFRIGMSSGSKRSYCTSSHRNRSSPVPKNKEEIVEKRGGIPGSGESDEK